MSALVKSDKKTVASVAELEKLADTVLAEVMSRLNIWEYSPGSQIPIDLLQQVAKEVSKAKTYEYLEKENAKKPEEEDLEAAFEDNAEEESEAIIVFEYNEIIYVKDDDNNLYAINPETQEPDDDENGNYIVFGYIDGEKIFTTDHKIFGTLKDDVVVKQ